MATFGISRTALTDVRSTKMQKSRVASLALEEGTGTSNSTATVSCTLRRDGAPSAFSPASSGFGPSAPRRIRRSGVARGLARSYSDFKAREIAPDTKPTRHQQQIVIVEEYRRKQARTTHERLEAAAAKIEINRAERKVIPANISNEFARKSRLRRPEHNRDQPAASNQWEENASQVSARRNEQPTSPTPRDIEEYARLVTQEGFVSDLKSPKSPGKTVNSAPKRLRDASVSTLTASNLHKPAQQVLCELTITKDILHREQLVEQLHRLARVVDECATQLQNISQRRAIAEADALAILLASSARNDAGHAKRGVALTSGHVAVKRYGIDGVEQTSPGKDSANTSRQEVETEDSQAIVAALTQRAYHHVQQGRRVISELCDVTMALVDGILTWRQCKQRKTRLSNIKPMPRFPWKPRHVANYMLHMDSDLRDLFPSALVAACLGSDATYTPLLLTRQFVVGMGFDDRSFVSTTFLTEQQQLQQQSQPQPLSPSASAPRAVSPTAPSGHDDGKRIVAGLRRGGGARSPDQHRRPARYCALLVAIDSLGDTNAIRRDEPMSGSRAEQVRRCLEAIQDECAWEQEAQATRAAEQARRDHAYSPFEGIKAIGGVEAALTSVLQRQAPHASELAEQLRQRQQDTTRARSKQTLMQQPSTEPSEPGHALPHAAPRLFVNPARLRCVVTDHRVPSLCILQDAGQQGNRLRGQLVVQQSVVRRQELHHGAVRIQRQFLVHRRRRRILQALTVLVSTTQAHVVQIQRVVRGHCARVLYTQLRHTRETQRQNKAAWRIWCAYTHSKRRWRHRQSMSVSSVAQAQLLHQVLQHQQQQRAQEPEEVEDLTARYRRVGEERRRQRAVFLQRRRLELLELERQRQEAAVRIQSVARMHAALMQAHELRQERRAHLTAVSVMTIQSRIRAFLGRQEKRRQRFRQDLARVNRSAVRIQAAVRGSHARAAGLQQEQKEAEEEQLLAVSGDGGGEGDDGGDKDAMEDGVATLVEPSPERLPVLPLAGSRPTSAVAPPSLAPSVSILPPIHAPSVEHVAAKRQPYRRPIVVPSPSISSSGMSKMELKLKEPVIGDDFGTASQINHSATSAVGPTGRMRRRDSRGTSPRV